VLEITEGLVVGLLQEHWPEKGAPEPEELRELARAIEAQFGVGFDPAQAPFVVDGRPAAERDALGRAVLDGLVAFLEEKRKRCDALAEQHREAGYPGFAQFERAFLLQTLDRQWKDHLHSMDGLREGINLRGYAQRDPKVEYQREGYGLFEEMNARIDQQAAEVILKFVLPDPVADRVAPRPAPLRAAAPAAQPGSVLERRPGAPAPARPAAAAAARPGAAPTAKVGRNDPCPCGSGKKYKKCCGAG
jgi:preprotein translocase subunit SecA